MRCVIAACISTDEHVASGDVGPSAGDQLRYSSATVALVLNPNPGVNWIELKTALTGLATALITYALFSEFDLVVTTGPESRQLASGWVTHNYL